MQLLLSFIPYLIISIIHLYACYYQKLSLRFKTKPFLLLSLIITYFLISPHNEPLVIAAMLTSFLGDVLLIFKKVFWFGVVSFWISDWLYACKLYTLLQTYKLIEQNKMIISLILIYLFMYVMIPYKSLFNSLGKLKALAFVFGLPLITNNMLALVNVMLNGINIANVMMFIGTTFYMVSDYTLIRGLFKSKINHESFYIMGTYILAQGGLVYGIIAKGL